MVSVNIQENYLITFLNFLRKLLNSVANNTTNVYLLINASGLNSLNFFVSSEGKC